MPESTNLLPGHGSLVTGAGRGLGAALVLDLLAQGAQLLHSLIRIVS